MKKLYVTVILLVLLSFNKAMTQESNHFKGVTYEYDNKNHQTKSLPDVHIQIKEVSSFMSGKDGIFDVSLRGKNEQKKITIKSLGKYGYVLSEPNPYNERFDWWTSTEPKKLYFKKVEDVNKLAAEFNRETAKKYERYHYELINGLYKRIEYLKSVSYIPDNQYLLASVNYVAVPIKTNDNTDEIDKIENDIVVYNENLEVNLNKIRLLSDEYARLIPMDSIDETFLYRLEQMKAGYFNAVFDKVRQECQSDKESFRINSRNVIPLWIEKRIFYNIRLLVLGLSEDRQLVESLLELMHRKQNISYKYEYARFLFNYKSIEKGNKIISMLENIDVNNYSDYIAYKILKLLRDIYIEIDEKQKALNTNSKIMSLLKNSMNNDETATINFYEAQNFEYKHKKDKNILKIVPRINRLNNSDAKINLLITNLCDIINLYIKGSFESSTTKIFSQYIDITPDLEPAKEYINTLENILDDKNIALSDDQRFRITATLYNYYTSYYTRRENNDKQLIYKEQLINHKMQMIREYPDVDEYAAQLLQVYVATQQYDEGEAWANHIIASNPFPFYTAFACFELGCIKMQQESYKGAKNYFKAAIEVFQSLDRKYPNMKVYRKSIVSIIYYLKILRDY